MTKEKVEELELPVLALRDVVIYPGMVTPLFVNRTKSINCLNNAVNEGKNIFIVVQKDESINDPKPEELYSFGTIATIQQLIKLPDGTVKVMVEGEQRGEINHFSIDTEQLSANISLRDSIDIDEQEYEVFIRSVLNQFDGYIKLHTKIPPEVLTSLSGIKDAARLADTMASHMPLKVKDKQRVLEFVAVSERLEFLMAQMEGEIDLLEVEKKIRSRVKKQMDQSQREHYLNEQIKAAQKELGEINDTPDELETLKVKIEEAQMPEEAKTKATAELNKLKMMSTMSAEATVVRSYIDWMLNVPWVESSEIKHDLAGAEKVLNNEHYGLEKVKERILEYLAVQQRVNKLKGPVLCLVGPPGVGKTSLGQSIARATGREYIRMALGGVKDEAEIRGHRRTYIGSMPGKIIQKLSKVGVKNPLLLLDEIDKMASDMRGDPASALLEVLDPEQNSEFNDHYLEVDYDLSDVMFVATSNSYNIPGPLLDRMEVIRLAGYTEDEKLNIAKQHLIDKQKTRNGLVADELLIEDSAIISIIRYYTREAGVRSLERDISNLCRKAVKEILLDENIKTLTITDKNLEDYLGVQRYDYGKADDSNRIGQVTGLAWTEVGGNLLTIECSAMPGKGKLSFTGSLGDIMQESIKAAITVVRNRCEKLRINGDFHEKRDIHVHVPEGATPKDGPSAGIGMVTGIVSSLTGNPVRSDVAMTGEITLRGEVLTIGGLKEKLLAAHRGGIKTVVIPKDNIRDLKDIPENVKTALEIRPVKWIDEVLEIALEEPIEAFSAIHSTTESQVNQQNLEIDNTESCVV